MNRSRMPRWTRIFPLLGLVLVQPGCELLDGLNSEAAPESELQGVVELEERALGFEVPGRVLEVNVERGDILETGAQLAKLDDALIALEYESLMAQASATRAELELLYEGTRTEEIEQARARLVGAEADVRAQGREYERVKQLYASDSVAQSELDRARGEFERAQAQRSEADQRLKELRQGPRAQEIQAGEARLRAAEASAKAADERIRRHMLFSDGAVEVLDVPIRFGEYVSAGTTIATVADTSRPYVDVFIPQGRVSELRVGMPVSVMADTLEVPLGARVEHIARTMEYSPRFLFSPRERPYLVLRARVRLYDPERKVRAGIPAFVTLEQPKAPLPPAPQARTAGQVRASGLGAGGSKGGEPARGTRSL